jgi:hypothetical protein
MITIKLVQEFLNKKDRCDLKVQELYIDDIGCANNRFNVVYHLLCVGVFLL